MFRLQDNFYALLGKVAEAKRCCIQEGDQHPSKEKIAKHVGITVDKLENLLFAARTPISLQQPVWADQETTYQVRASSLLFSLCLFDLINQQNQGAKT